MLEKALEGGLGEDTPPVKMGVPLSLTAGALVITEATGAQQ